MSVKLIYFSPSTFLQICVKFLEDLHNSCWKFQELPLFPGFFSLNIIINVTDSRRKSICTYTKRGRYEYSGSQSTTCSERQCKVWDSFGPDLYTNLDFPLDQHLNLSSLKSCRNPDLRTGGEWCYTSSRGSGFETCCLPPCEGRLYI